MASKIPHVKRAERAARQSPHPDDQALLLRPKHKLLPVRERGRLAVQRRPDPGPWRSPQPQHWAAALWPGWQDGRQQRARGPDRPHAAHLPGPGRGWPAGARPDPQGPARRGAAGRPRAREKQRAACRGEKRRQEDLARLRPRPLKSRKTAAGDEEKKGAGKAVGLPRLAPGPPEKSKGKRGPSKTSSGGHRPEPRARGDLDVGALWDAAGGGVLLGEREEDGAPGGMRVPRRSARLSPGPKDCLGPYPRGQEDDLEPRWPGGVTWGRAASPPPSPRPPREGSRWKRELESVFRELFSTNRKLKTHLNRYLESRSGTDTCPSEKQAADPLMELGLGPAARPAAPSANLKELLRQLKDRQYLRMVQPLFADEGGLAPHPEEEAPPWCSLPPLHEPPRPAPLLPQLPPQALAGRAGPAAWPRQSPEQRWRPQLVEVHEVPQLSWEALGTPLGAPGEETEMTETETELGAPTRALPAHLAHLAGCTPLRLEEPRGCECGPPASAPAPAPAPSPPAASSEEEEDDDRGHSQMIHDLQKQILEQSKSHKQFLDQARRRLKEFQSELIRAKVVSQKEVGSGEDVYGNPIKKIQYEIKQIKMFKGPDRDIEFIYTAPSSAICGVSLDVGGKKEYLIAGRSDGDGKMHITLCDFIVPWDTLTTTQKKSLNHRYQMGCECKITRCLMIPCYVSSVDECLWMDWVTEKSINGHQAKFFACIKRNDGSCAWYRGAAPPKPEFLDIQDP